MDKHYHIAKIVLLLVVAMDFMAVSAQRRLVEEVKLDMKSPIEA